LLGLSIDSENQDINERFGLVFAGSGIWEYLWNE